MKNQTDLLKCVFKMHVELNRFARNGKRVSTVNDSNGQELGGNRTRTRLK